MTGDGSVPYEIETPWRAQDLFNLDYTQNADVMTFVCPGYPPQELRRYSITDWRLRRSCCYLQFAHRQALPLRESPLRQKIKTLISCTQYYVVTALNEDRTEESEASAKAQVVANLFATGTTVKVNWQTVPSARYYRVYRVPGWALWVHR